MSKNKFKYNKITLSYNADKLFKEFLKSVEEKNLNVLKKFNLQEISELIPYEKSQIEKYSTYNYSFMSMLAGQKERDYFNFVKPSVKKDITDICNDAGRNNKAWEKLFLHEEVKINPKYILDLWNKAYLIIYNPDKNVWEDINEDIEEIKINGFHLASWSSGVRKEFEEGARVYLIQLGVEKKGIFASGWINNASYKDLHWDKTKAEVGLITNYVEIEFDSIMNPNECEILLKDVLDEKFPEMKWSQRASGVEIIDVDLDNLEEVWSSYRNHDIELSRTRVEKLAEEIIEPENYIEGSARQIYVNAYE